MFGLCFLGDSATIRRTPFMNILGMCGTIPPVTISIHDCTGHMAMGGKKDAPFIANLFEEKILECDPHGLLTDVFFFDGASNVQKAGEVLMAKFPHSFCFHGGGEHVISLFFSSIAKIETIKVRLYILRQLWYACIYCLYDIKLYQSNTLVCLSVIDS